jgi:hypothetical protein
VGGVTRQGALQHLQAQAVAVHAAAAAVGEGHHTIHIGEISQIFGPVEF